MRFDHWYVKLAYIIFFTVKRVLRFSRSHRNWGLLSSRYACSRDIASIYSGRKCSGIVIAMMLYPFNDTCVRVCVKATRRGWSGCWKPGCGTLRQCASPSCFIDLLAYPSSSSSSAILTALLFVGSPSQPSPYNPLSFPLFLLSTFVSLLFSLLLLFRLIFLSSRTRADKHRCIFSCTIFVKFSFLKNSASSVWQREIVIWEKYPLFFILKISNFLDFNIRYLFLSVNNKLKFRKFVYIWV